MQADLEKYGEEFEALLKHHEDYKAIQVQIAEKRESEFLSKIAEASKIKDRDMV